MRKLNYLALAALAAASINAQADDYTYGNPKDAEGNYIVRYDLEKGAFAESNDWEIDETIVFAIDLTGTPLADALKNPSRNPNVLGRGVAYDLFMTSAPEGTTGKMNIDGRLMHIKDNIYGMTVNFYQQHVSRYADAGMGPNSDYSDYEALQPGAVVTWDSNIFGFGWSATNPGEEWWDAVAAPQTDSFPFACAPYTGTKTSKEFFYGDVTPAEECPFAGLDPAAYHDMCDSWGGYAAPTAEAFGAATPVETIAAEAATVNSTYFDLQGRQVSAPAQGVYIRQDVKADGSVSAVKVVK
ncbi:MAG: hypothetical protein K2I45_08020 [Muribaculaceae bacterium]|nr:hypothetical protein [Muribaculaceae bacterium]